MMINIITPNNLMKKMNYSQYFSVFIYSCIIKI